jgi:hypothetical protein
MLGHDLKISLVNDFIFFDFPNAYKEELVINVERRSRLNNNDAFEDIKNFIKPLSLKLLHFDRFKFLREVINCELDSFNKV